MRQTNEYIIVGGPEHGSISHRPCDPDAAEPWAHSCCDGDLCVVAARRHDKTGTRYILLHPRATGAQFLAMLAA